MLRPGGPWPRAAPASILSGAARETPKRLVKQFTMALSQVRGASRRPARGSLLGRVQAMQHRLVRQGGRRAAAPACAAHARPPGRRSLLRWASAGWGMPGRRWRRPQAPKHGGAAAGARAAGGVGRPVARPSSAVARHASSWRLQAAAAGGQSVSPGPSLLVSALPSIVPLSTRSCPCIPRPALGAGRV